MGTVTCECSAILIQEGSTVKSATKIVQFLTGRTLGLNWSGYRLFYGEIYNMVIR